MSESASPRATTAVTRPVNTPSATSAAAHDSDPFGRRMRVRVVMTAAGISRRGSESPALCARALFGDATAPVIAAGFGGSGGATDAGLNGMYGVGSIAGAGRTL